MAGVEQRTDGKKVTYRIRLSEGEDTKRPRIGLGKVTRKEALSACAFVENLVSYCNTGKELKPDTQKWLATIRPVVRKRLEALKLIEPQTVKEEVKERTTLSEWINGYIDGRTDIKPNTLRNMKMARNGLFGFCDKEMLIVDFTAYHAEEFRRHCLEKGLAEATIRRRCKRLKQFFTAARKRRLISENPFDGIPISTATNAKRKFFISKEIIQQVIDACPNAEWRLIFALARYGGLRIPSELWGLVWDEIDWDKKRFIIHSPKTEHHEGKETRICPIFPELEPYLLEVYEQSKPGQSKVITIYSEDNSNLRTQAERILKRAGVKAWPKLFTNLRSSRETELVETFPLHVVTEWLGNSPEIARKHYLQVTEEHYRMGAEKGGLNRGQTEAETQGKSRKDSQEEKTQPVQNWLKNIDLRAISSPYELMQVLVSKGFIPPRGLEPLLPG
jgi:integrase